MLEHSASTPPRVACGSKKMLLVDALPSDPEIIARYEKADMVSAEQTAHGLPHAENVRDNAAILIAMIDQEYPGLLSDDDKVCALISAMTHDNGRADEIAKHGLMGARWANEFLPRFTVVDGEETIRLSDEDIKRIVKGIACHSYKEFINVKVPDVVLDITYIADKCAGDESRVREDRAAELAKLARYSVNLFGKWLRLTWRADKSREGGEHDRVNYAIKQVSLLKDGRNIVLKLDIDLRVCDPELIWSVRWNRTAYQGCWVAANRLGFEFQLEINNVRYVSEGQEADWRPR